MNAQTLQPQHDEDLERALVGSALIGKMHVDLDPNDLFIESCRRVLEAVRAVEATGAEVDPVLVNAHLKETGRLEQVGGTGYVTELQNSVPVYSPKQIAEYARKIRELAQKRRITLRARLIVADLGHDVGDFGKWCTQAQNDIAEALAPGEMAKPSGLGIIDVLARWREEGPLVHEPTGIAVLDSLTGGGPVYGTRWYLVGAPDAGKTAILLQWIAEWAARKIVVGVLAVDEEPSDLVMRIAQRAGYSRTDCEQRYSDITERLAEDLVASNLARFVRFYDDRWTIETAAADLAKYAGTIEGEHGLAFVVDSIQAVACDASRGATKELGPRESVTANVRALRAVATRYRAICVGTSEMNRGAYRSVEQVEGSNDMAAGAESRAIEFSARVMLSLRSVSGNGELVEVRAVKNKHGRSYPASKEAQFYLRIDRNRQALTETDAPPREQAEPQKDLESVRRDAALVAAMIASNHGVGVNALKDKMRAAYGSFSDPRVGAAREVLGDALLEVDGPRRAKFLHLDGSKLGHLEELIPLDVRPATLASRHPTHVGEA